MERNMNRKPFSEALKEIKDLRYMKTIIYTEFIHE
jgi:hypothetical protein